MAKKNTKVKELLLQLNNEDATKQLEAVKSLKMHGDKSAIEPLVHLLATTEDEQIEKEIILLLNTIKISDSPEEIINCLTNPSFAEVRIPLLCSIWNTGLDYRPYLKEILAVTVQGGIEESLECITIIENQEGKFSEEQLYEGLLILNEYLVNNQNDKGPKTEMLIEMREILQQMNDNL